MKKAVNMALGLLGHKLRIGFQIRPDDRESLERRNDKIVRDFKQGYSIIRLADKYDLTENRISPDITHIKIEKQKMDSFFDSVSILSYFPAFIKRFPVFLH